MNPPSGIRPERVVEHVLLTSRKRIPRSRIQTAFTTFEQLGHSEFVWSTTHRVPVSHIAHDVLLIGRSYRGSGKAGALAFDSPGRGKQWVSTEYSVTDAISRAAIGSRSPSDGLAARTRTPRRPPSMGRPRTCPARSTSMSSTASTLTPPFERSLSEFANESARWRLFDVTRSARSPAVSASGRTRPRSPRRAPPCPDAPRLRTGRSDRRVLELPAEPHLRRAPDRRRGGPDAAGGPVGMLRENGPTGRRRKPRDLTSEAGVRGARHAPHLRRA
jgi:hypothetical protein